MSILSKIILYLFLTILQPLRFQFVETTMDGDPVCSVFRVSAEMLPEVRKYRFFFLITTQ